MCDIVPPFVQHESVIAYFDKLGDKMQHMQIIDSDGSSDTHIIPGEGVLPMKELFQELKKRLNEEFSNRYEQFYQRFCSWEDGNAAMRVVEAVFK